MRCLIRTQSSSFIFNPKPVEFALLEEYESLGQKNEGWFVYVNDSEDFLKIIEASGNSISLHLPLGNDHELLIQVMDV